MAAGKKTGGRQRGTPNKITADIKALAAQYAPAAMIELARLALNSESDAARVAAIKELFDRGYGRPSQSVSMDATVTTKELPASVDDFV